MASAGSSKGKKDTNDAQEEGVEVAKELIKLGGERLMGFYKGTGMMEKVVERVIKECSELL